MSLVQSLRFDVVNSVRNSSSSSPSRDGTQGSRPSSIAVASPPPDTTSVEAATLPAQRRVFDVAPLNVMGKSRKTAITILIISSNLIQMMSNATTIGGGLALSRHLGVEDPSKANWIGASYALTQGTFVLMSGRLGSVYGHKNILLVGGAWFALWSLINGFCDSFLAFNIARAFTGVGGAFILPNAVAMLAITTPPGRMRNLSLGFFAASAPIGGWLGALLAGAIMHFAAWKWIFFCLAILGSVVIVTLWLLFPPERPVDPNGKIDYIGAAMGISALVLFNFVWNQAPAVGWSTPYEIALLVTSVVLLAIFVLWEKKSTKEPIIPLDIFEAPSFGVLVLVILLSYMAVGTAMWYQAQWQQILRHWSALGFAVGWLPFGIFAVIAGFVAAWLIPRLGAQWILALGAGSILLTNLLLTTMPEQQSYWVQMFPANILMAFCPDLVYTAAQIIASNSVRRHQQGIAGSLVGTLNLYGNSLGLGFAGTVEVQTSKQGQHLAQGYRSALWFGVGIAAIALVLDMAFVRMAKDDREGWTDENDRDPADDGIVLASGTALESGSRRAAVRTS
ncbi:MAG: hypothetical protein M1822_003075 [Bathelium mastoideum]|nr:MAG: hypothetical protein M1822_003075 [Bathelium mastoideum]